MLEELLHPMLYGAFDQFKVGEVMGERLVMFKSFKNVLGSLGSLLFFVVIVFWQSSVSATDLNPGFHPRSFRLGVTGNQWLQKGIEGAESQGPGFLAVYEFNLNPQFTLGIDLEYRTFAPQKSQRRVGQLGYGLLLKHSLASATLSPWAGVPLVPYFEYGLLMNVSRIQSLPRSGTSHDTRLAVGVDFPLGQRSCFVDVSYHYSKLDYFDQPRIDLDYAQISLGWRWAR